MGLLGRMMGQGSGKKATDDVLLMHSMLLMCAADGVFEDSEFATLDQFINTLPEFKGKDIDGLITQAKKVVSKYGNVKDSVKALGEIQSPAVRTKAFILAADIAMSSGDVDENEDQLLEAMQRVLGLDDALAQKVIEVMALKYAQ